jgi:hypothetical protein
MANAKMQKASMDAYISTQAASMQQIGGIGQEVISNLMNINNNLAALVQFNNDNMQRFIDSSITYYEKAGSHLDPGKEKSSKISAADVISGSKGGINIDTYKKYVKQQIKKVADSSTAGQILSMLEDENTLNMLASNPLGLLSEMTIKQMMPQMLVGTIKAVEASFSNAMPKLLTDLSEWANDYTEGLGGKIKRTIGSVFGLHTEEATSMKKSAKIEYGAIPFDGETKHAITDIITKELNLQTGYLSVIAKHFDKKAKDKVEKGRQFWDKKTNSYVTKKGLDVTIADTIVDSIRSAYSDTYFGKQMNTLVSSQTTDKSKESMQTLLDELYLTITQSDGKLSLSDLLELTKSLGGTRQEKEALKDFLNKKRPHRFNL